MRVMIEGDWQRRGICLVEMLAGGWMALDLNPVMNIRTILRYLPAAVLALSLNSCIAQRTVTQSGRPVQKHNVIKRPLRDVFQNSR